MDYLPSISWFVEKLSLKNNRMHIFLIILTILFTVLANVYYIVTIFRGETKTHIFSWILWAIVNILASIIQLQHGAAWWALTLGLGGIICVFVVIVSLWYGEKDITRLDILSFILALSILPLWLWAKEDLTAMMLAIFIDALSFAPTARKSFHKPHEENLLPYFAGSASFFMSIFLTQEKTLINLLYPVVICCVNFSFIGYIYFRRKIIR
jgi:hypothetical protein